MRVQRRWHSNDVHKLLKYAPLAGALAVALFLVCKGEGPTPLLPDAASTTATPSEALKATSQATPKSALQQPFRTSSSSPITVSPDEENRDHADCWARCGSPCTDEAGACPSKCEHDDECESDELCMPTRATADGQRFRRCLSDQCSGIGMPTRRVLKGKRVRRTQLCAVPISHLMSSHLRINGRMRRRLCMREHR